MAICCSLPIIHNRKCFFEWNLATNKFKRFSEIWYFLEISFSLISRPFLPFFSFPLPLFPPHTLCQFAAHLSLQSGARDLPLVQLGMQSPQLGVQFVQHMMLMVQGGGRREGRESRSRGRGQATRLLFVDSERHRPERGNVLYKNGKWFHFPFLFKPYLLFFTRGWWPDSGDDDIPAAHSTEMSGYSDDELLPTAFGGDGLCSSCSLCGGFGCTNWTICVCRLPTAPTGEEQPELNKRKIENDKKYDKW